NTAEMRTTELYTEAVYPVTASEGSYALHAWEGCPGVAAGALSGLGSLSQMESGSFETCTHCDFTASSLGKVAAASTAIDNGFEYHYNIVADAAAAYQKAREQFQPQADTVKSLVGSIFDKAKATLETVASHRLVANPPGSFGSLAFVADVSTIDVSQRFPSSFVQSGTTLGTRAALSTATLASDNPEEGKTVITALLDSVRDKSSAGALGGMGVVLDLWSSVLFAYADGMESFEQGIKEAIGAIPLISDSGLGEWAAKAFSDMAHSLGLQPAALDSPKPVLVNSAHLLKADSSSFASLMLEAKGGSIAAGGAVSGDFFTTVLSLFEIRSLEAIHDGGGNVEIAVIEPFGEGGPSVPITIAVPPAATSIAADAVEGAVDAMKSIYAQAGGARPWE
ncbi:MAG: molybdenum cofactor biosynthesis enzyme, partial [Raoultibacter sp.]